MGRHLDFSTSLAFASFAALFILSTSASLPLTAEARTPSGQMVPVISLETPLARDADTFESDRALEAACRQTGQEKSVCLCVTHIMKYELTLAEHKAAIRLYGQNGDRTALYTKLQNEGFEPSDINMAEQMERSLTEDSDFALRCTEAKSYYKTPSK
ncbi:MAG: hypothetical protein ABJN22_01100 [Litorimonas sp.]